MVESIEDQETGFLDWLFESSTRSETVSGNFSNGGNTSDQRKICPIRFVICAASQCAWWNQKHSCCIMYAVAASIANITASKKVDE